MRGIEKEIESLDGILEIFSTNQHKGRARQLLEKRIETLLARLQQIAEGREQRS